MAIPILLLKAKRPRRPVGGLVYREITHAAHTRADGTRVNAFTQRHLVRPDATDGAREKRDAGAADPRLKALLKTYAGDEDVSPAELADAVRQYREVERRHAALLRVHDEGRAPLPAPNGEPSNLNREQWVLVRTPNFRRWFGDWEAAQAQDWLDLADPVAVMQGTEVPKFERLKSLVAWVAQDWQQRIGSDTVNHPELGAVTVGRKAVGTSLAHGFGPEKVQALYLVPQALAAGRVLGSLPRETNKPEAIMVAAPIGIGDKTYRMLMEVRRDVNMQRLYVHEVVLRESPGNPAFVSSAAPDGGQPQGAGTGAIWKFMQGLRDLQSQTSKVVDANGEPMVFYHGTFGDFSAFERKRLGENTLKDAEGDGWGQTSRVGFWFNDRPMGQQPDRYGAGYTVDMPVFLRACASKRYSSIDGLAAAIVGRATTGIGLKNKLQRDGFDGVHMRDEEFGGESRVVFSRTQIKSAIGNAGTFKPGIGHLNKAAAPAASSATPAQLDAGNYRKPKRAFQGLRISIENPRGSVRSGIGPGGKRWRTRMRWDYGYILGSEGVDGDHVDCYVGPDDSATHAYVVHQRKAGAWDRFDEDKVMLGFRSESAARRAYLAHYDDARFLGPVTAIPMDAFARKVLASRGNPRMLKAQGSDSAPADPHPQYMEAIRRKLADLAVLQRRIAGTDKAIAQAAELRLESVQRELAELRPRAHVDDDAAGRYRELILERGRLHRLSS